MELHRLVLPLLLYLFVEPCLVIGDGSPNVTYIPGKLTVEENGLLLSTGLTSRLIAHSGKRVPLSNGKKSHDVFHGLPDGAAVFTDESTGDYVYVSNSEKFFGGVGAIYFNSDHEVTGYKRLLKWSVRNCGGGKMWWGTWVSCEERKHHLGRIWEIDPWDRQRPKKTVMGRIRKGFFGIGTGAPFESAAYDRRDVDHPTFYITIDDTDGPLVRFTPDPDVVAETNESGDFSKLLHTGDNITRDFLLLDSVTSTFTWTKNRNLASASAREHYSGGEGIGMLELLRPHGISIGRA
jgi:hypothetical protein